MSWLTRLSVVLFVSIIAGATVEVAQAQPLGSFTWQLQPFCNRVTVNVRQDGAVYTLDGFDDLCGAPQRAPLVGLATPNPDGTIGFGLNIVLPDGQNGSVEARITLPGLSGTWRDAGGNTGAFAFGGSSGAGLRPTATPGSGDITGVISGTGLTGGGASGDVTLAVNPALVQSRVTTTCLAGQALRSINQNGTALCEPITGSAGGDITAVTAGPGLSGGGTTGDVSLAVVFSGPGFVNAAARSDHTHAVSGDSSTGVGAGALQANTAGQNTAVGAGALSATTTGIANTAVGRLALQHNVSGFDNTAVGRHALIDSVGNVNTAVGSLSLDANTSGAQNTALGGAALGATTTGSNNVAVGIHAGLANTTGSGNTFIGQLANAGSGALTNATAIGANAQVDQSNALVLGAIDGINSATENTRVGIGLTAPETLLDIEDRGGSLAHGIVQATTRGGATFVTNFMGRNSRGTTPAPTAVLSGDSLAAFGGVGHDGAEFQSFATGRIVIQASEDWIPGSHGNRIMFQVGANGTANSSTAAMLINHDRNVGVGVFAPLDRLQVAGDVRVGTAGTNGCLKNFSGGLIIGSCSSDLRFKRDVTPFEPSLDRVAALRPVHHFWRSEAFPEKGFGPDRAYGLIAQEVEAVLPELVTTDALGYRAVDYSKLPLLAIQAIKELKEKNDTLEQRLAALEARLASITR